MKLESLIRAQAIEWPGTSIVRRELRKARIYSGLTQLDLAEEVGVSRNILGQWERGLTKPSDEHMITWREALYG